MPNASQLRLPPIADENLFEDLCRDLWSQIWDDPNAQRNGRRGQAQCGVDIFGMPKGHEGYEGVQAKAVGVPLTDPQIQRELNDAKKFEPPLCQLIIATTASRDAKGQLYVRKLNIQHRNEGLFNVSLLGWEDIARLAQDHLVDKHPLLAERYFQVSVASATVA